MSRAQDHSCFACLHVRDAAGLYAEGRRNGVEIWHPLMDQTWGTREFAIVTPDGHWPVLCEELSARPEAKRPGKKA